MPRGAPFFFHIRDFAALFAALPRCRRDDAALRLMPPPFARCAGDILLIRAIVRCAHAARYRGAQWRLCALAAMRCRRATLDAMRPGGFAAPMPFYADAAAPRRRALRVSPPPLPPPPRRAAARFYARDAMPRHALDRVVDFHDDDLQYDIHTLLYCHAMPLSLDA